MEENRESQRKGFNSINSKTEENICTDIAFTMTHPPDVSHRSRIVAVCGIADHDNLADPENDGWLLSDFYLFHHLFNPLRIYQSSLTLLLDMIRPNLNAVSDRRPHFIPNMVGMC